MVIFVSWSVYACDQKSPQEGNVQGARPAIEDSILYESRSSINVENSSSDKTNRPIFLKQIIAYGSKSNSESSPVSEQTVRIVLVLDGVGTYRRGELSATQELPRRIFLDLDAVYIEEGIPSTIPIGTGGLRRVRAFALNQETTRVSFDVEDTAAYRLFYLTQPYRIIMDFRDSKPVTNLNRESRFSGTIVLDPGHGGQETGAHGPNGLKESILTLDVARRVRRVIRRELSDYRILLTRERDTVVSLEERAAIANGYAADLFVSIHFNSSSNRTDKGGVSTFILDNTDDRQAIRLAAKENGTDEKGVTDLQVILASLYRKEQVQRSKKLAKSIQTETLSSGRKILPALYNRGVKSALFFVLVGTRMPSVLVEASFITQPEEAAALGTERYRQSLANGIARGIIRFIKEK